MINVPLSIGAAVMAMMIWLVAGASAAMAQPGPTSRSEATAIIAGMRRIVSPHGIERLETVRIGGIDQWLSIRGTDRRNPVLLMLHGGPGYQVMPHSWYFQRGWEDYFTVVQWDQRGSGKTYATNDADAVAPTMTIDRMIKDTEEVIAWLRREFDRDKIFVLGHSWGSVLGLSVARKHPQWLHAYISTAQMVDGYESDRRGWRFAIERARETRNTQAIKELEAIAPYAVDGKPLALEDLYVQRKWLGHFGGAVSGRPGFEHEIAAVQLAPEYTDRDLDQVWKGNAYASKHLLMDAMAMDFSDVDSLDCPLILFLGRDDRNVSSTLGEEWFARIEAPSKTLEWFEHSAHELFNEEPGKTLVSLVRHARPIAERAGDVPPSR